jgi:hypothetical protein
VHQALSLRQARPDMPALQTCCFASLSLFPPKSAAARGRLQRVSKVARKKGRYAPGLTASDCWNCSPIRDAPSSTVLKMLKRARFLTGRSAWLLRHGIDEREGQSPRLLLIVLGLDTVYFESSPSQMGQLPRRFGFYALGPGYQSHVTQHVQ